MKFLKALFWYVAGFFIVPYLCLVTPKGSKKWKYLDHIYGNKSSDGLDGDPDYQRRVKRFRRFRWYLRNPINNYLRSLGPNGTIQRITGKSDKEVDYLAIWVDGKKYWMYDVRLIGRIHLWFGYKLLEDWRPEINARIEIGKHFENEMLFWPFKATDRDVLKPFIRMYGRR